MTGKFHKNLNRMSFFILGIISLLVFFFYDFINIATENIYLNGVIIGVTLFGIILSFISVFQLLPEYRWIKKYFIENDQTAKKPYLFKTAYIMLNNNKSESLRLSAQQVNSILEIVMNRFDSERETLRYVTNALIFLGLLGTFWGLVSTLGGFADLIMTLDFTYEDILVNLQQGIYKPIYGMSVAFTSSLLGLAGSLIIGFLNLQVNQAQNNILESLEDNLSKFVNFTDINDDDLIKRIKEIEKSAQDLRKRILK